MIKYVINRQKHSTCVNKIIENCKPVMLAVFYGYGDDDNGKLDAELFVKAKEESDNLLASLEIPLVTIPLPIELDILNQPTCTQCHENKPKERIGKSKYCSPYCEVYGLKAERERNGI